MTFAFNVFLRVACVGVLFFAAGCATVARGPLPGAVTPASVKGVYHKVAKGETLFRIARAYQIPVENITRSNNIPNAASIEEGQLLLIPGADVVQKVVMPLPAGAKDPSEFSWPVEGRVISYFDDRRGLWRNRGIDIRTGDEDIVKAARDGRVVFSDRLAGYGQAIIIDHADGIFSVYGHNDRLLVKLGDYVFRGEKIAQAGGKSGEAYAHFEVRRGDRADNPLHYLP